MRSVNGINMNTLYEIEQAKIKISYIQNKISRSGEKYRVLIDSKSWSWIVWYKNLKFEINKTYIVTYLNKGKFREIKSIDKIL